jgi:hypothetical protein
LKQKINPDPITGERGVEMGRLVGASTWTVVNALICSVIGAGGLGGFLAFVLSLKIVRSFGWDAMTTFVVSEVVAVLVGVFLGWRLLVIMLKPYWKRP